MTDEPLHDADFKPRLSAAERAERLAKQKADGAVALEEHRKHEAAKRANMDRLKAERLDLKKDSKGGTT